MKYKDFNKIVDAYKKMADQNRKDGNEKAAKSCEFIIEDLQYLFKLGYSKQIK